MNRGSVLARLFRMVSIGATSGLVAGLLWGIGARLAMRIIAIMGDGPTELTFEGTIFILLFGGVYGIVVGLIYLALWRLAPGSERRKKLVYGVVLLGLGFPFCIGPLLNEAAFGHQALAVVLFGGLFLIAGIVVAAVFAWLDRVVPGSARRVANMARLSS